jgi:hypothetical protein
VSAEPPPPPQVSPDGIDWGRPMNLPLAAMTHRIARRLVVGAAVTVVAHAGPLAVAHAAPICSAAPCVIWPKFIAPAADKTTTILASGPRVICTSVTFRRGIDCSLLQTIPWRTMTLVLVKVSRRVRTPCGAWTRARE